MVLSWFRRTAPPPGARQGAAGLPFGLLGGVGAGNTGNEVSLEVVRSSLAREHVGARFALITPMPAQARASVAGPDEVVPMRAARDAGAARTASAVGHRVAAEAVHAVRTVRAVGGLRAVVVCGTGILDDFEEPAWGMPWSLLLWAAAARLRHRPFVLVAVGAGPVTGRVSGAFFGAAVRLASAVTYRDEASLRTMTALGAARADARVTCDLAFGHAVPDGRLADPGPGMRLGVGVMDWSGWKGADLALHERYLGVLVDTVVAALERGHRVLLLTGQPVDRPVAEDVRARVLRTLPTADGSIQVAPTGTFDDLCRAVRSTDVVLAARFHTVIAAVLCGRPVVSMGYSRKNRDLLASLGMEEKDRGIDVVTADWLLARIDEYASGGGSLGSAAETVAGWQGLTREELRRLGRCLVATPGRPSAPCSGPTTRRPWRQRRTRGWSSRRGGSR